MASIVGPTVFCAGKLHELFANPVEWKELTKRSLVLSIDPNGAGSNHLGVCAVLYTGELFV